MEPSYEELYRRIALADGQSGANTIALSDIRRRLDQIDIRLEELQETKQEIVRQRIWVEVSVRILRWGFRIVSWIIAGVVGWLWTHWDNIQAFMNSERK